MSLRACKWCGKEYEHRHHWFCSEECRRDRTKARQRGAYERWKNKDIGRFKHVQRKKLYGITRDAYDGMMASQDGRCAICSRPFGPDRNDTPHVDHSHATGVVRGLLCPHCNHGLGFFKDRPDLMRAAISYLESSDNSVS